MTSRRRRLGDILVAAGVLTEQDLARALRSQAEADRRERLGSTILRLGLAEPADIARGLSSQLGLDLVDLSEVAPDSNALKRVPRRLAERHNALPLRVKGGDILVVAMSDPTDVFAIDDLRLTSGMREVVPVVTTERDVSSALDRAFGSDSAALDLVDAYDNPSIGEVEDVTRDLDDNEEIGEQPIIRIAAAILADAVRQRASDVHLEPERDRMRVRYRIDGLLREALLLPRNVVAALTSRYKVMSGLDIAERRRPQDGRTAVRVAGVDVDLRVSTMPTMFGETLVIRLLRTGAERLTIDDLGLGEDVRDVYFRALERPQGTIVLTGPTGSGKTTTLYGGLAHLANPERNLLTLEDPVEYQLDGVNQTQVNPKIGLTFARGMRTMLRQDPDVIMIGEIRDTETAQLVMNASLTGHLVLTTLHTNDAPATVVRLRELDVEPFLVASSLSLVMAQRLARTVCPTCAVEDEPTDHTLDRLGLLGVDLSEATLRRGTGCEVCNRTGYHGRVAIVEALVVTPTMRDLITDGAPESAIARLARAEGMRTLREEGMRKAFAGIITLDEVLRVTPDELVLTQVCGSCHGRAPRGAAVCGTCGAALPGSPPQPEPEPVTASGGDAVVRPLRP